MSRYDALTDALLKRKEQTLTLTFTELDEIVGNLPASATKYPEWWTNNKASQPHSRAWLDAGRRAKPDFARREATFTLDSHLATGEAISVATSPPKLLFDTKAFRQKNHQITGNIGLYFCCYKLSLMGWNVMPTARNARGVDIVAYSGDASRFVGIQVKALSKRNPVPLGTSLDKCMGDWWIIITEVASHKPSAFILSPGQVISNAHRGEKDGRVSYWLQPSSYDNPDFKEAWDRIGHGGLDAQPVTRE